MVMRWTGSAALLRAAAGALALGLVVALFWGGAQPQAVNLVPAPWDFLAHAAVYGLLALCVGAALPVPRRAAPWLGLAAAVALGLLDEWHQTGLPGRHADVGDLLADALGALMGAVLLWWLSGLRRERMERDGHG